MRCARSNTNTSPGIIQLETFEYQCREDQFSSRSHTSLRKQVPTIDGCIKSQPQFTEDSIVMSRHVDGLVGLDMEMITSFRYLSTVDRAGCGIDICFDLGVPP